MNTGINETPAADIADRIIGRIQNEGVFVSEKELRDFIVKSNLMDKQQVNKLLNLSIVENPDVWNDRNDILRNKPYAEERQDRICAVLQYLAGANNFEDLKDRIKEKLPSPSKGNIHTPPLKEVFLHLLDSKFLNEKQTKDIFLKLKCQIEHNERISQGIDYYLLEEVVRGHSNRI